MDSQKLHLEIIRIQKEMISNHELRESLSKTLMDNLGTGDNFEGINLDELTVFARKVMFLNKEFEILSTTHKNLMAVKR
tara:strand:+ start:1943 stop:2179 length:237 start_codon:yes stop_codon:yes gene_type:complete